MGRGATMRTIADAEYADLIQHVLENGACITTRNHSTFRLCAPKSITFTSFPLVTLKKTAVKKALLEMQWFMSGNETCPDELKDWWAGQLNHRGAYVNGYATQLRYSPSSDGSFDQIEYIIEGIKKSPNSRRLCLSSWNTGDMASITVENNNHQTPSTCITGVMKVIEENRGIIDIRDLNINDNIWDGTRYVKVLNKWSNGIKKVKKYSTRDGSITLTENHKVFDGTKVREIQHAKRIAVVTGGYVPRTKINAEKVMDGLVLGDGTTSFDECILHIGEKDKDYFNSEIAPLILRHMQNKNHDNTRYRVKTSYQSLPKTYNRVLPEDILSWDVDDKFSFLRGLFSANGTTSKTTIAVGLTQASKILIEQVQFLLNTLGIRSRIHSRQGKDVTFRNGVYHCKDSHFLSILKKDTHKFIESIGFLQNYKNEILKINQNTTLDRKTSGFTDIEDCEEQEVFDITIDSPSHLFWCNGFLISNCHLSFVQFFVEYGRLCMFQYQRSCDVLLGLPHNFVQHFSLLTYIAHHTGLDVGWFQWQGGDVHIYDEPSHIDVAQAIVNAQLPEYLYNMDIELVYTPTSDKFLASDFIVKGDVDAPVTTVRPKLL
jgi:thymidylate synthase